MANISALSSFLGRLNKTLLFGIMMFSSGVALFVAFGSHLPSVYSEERLELAPFPPDRVVTDSCLIEQDVGYLSFRAIFYEQGTTNKVVIPAHVVITGPNNNVLIDHDYAREINSFMGSEPPGTYSVTITSLEDQNDRITQGTPAISYDLVCRTKDGYDLGQSFGTIMVLGNLMYLVGFPIMIYGIVKERKIRKRQAIASGYWKSRVQEHKSNRPLGVTLLAIGSIAVASLLLLGSLIFAAFSAAASNSSAVRGEAAVLRESMPFPLAELDLAAISGIFLMMGIVSAVEGYGLLRGKGWAWTLTLITCFISIALSILYMFDSRANYGDAIFDLALGLGLSGIIIYYLQRPAVRRYFGKMKKGHK